MYRAYIMFGGVRNTYQVLAGEPALNST